MSRTPGAGYRKSGHQDWGLASQLRATGSLGRNSSRKLSEDPVVLSAMLRAAGSLCQEVAGADVPAIWSIDALKYGFPRAGP